MEWEMKMPPWDLAELGRDDELGHRTNSMDCSVDLKLGGSENSEMLNSWKNRPGRSTATTTKSSPAPLKRSRSVGGGAACLVDGCNSDLSNCREYHRRHKVCEMHAKTPIVMVKGQEQRFCQQCSRFHPLMEFDEVKRSCRKRLDGHNRRRRKPQPDTINAAHFFHRPRFPSFSPFSPAATKTEDTTFFASLPAAENGIHSLIGPDSACALSLLSSPIQYPDGAAVAEAVERIPMGQPLGTSFFYRSLLGSGHVPPAGFSCAAGVEEAAEQAGGAADGGFHGQGFFHLGIDGASSRPFPFSWQ